LGSHAGIAIVDAAQALQLVKELSTDA